jgi:hypothetical protein
MQDNIVRDVIGKLARFEQRFRSKREAHMSLGMLPANVPARYDRFDQKRRDIQLKLKARLEGSHGIDWELLKLELQNDILLLTTSFEHWSQRLDAKFNKQK